VKFVCEWKKAEMKYWENGPLKVGGSQRYLENGTKPFFWMGDTAWLLFQKCTEVEAFLYLKNRKEKGFNVIQATLVHKMPGEPKAAQGRAEWDVASEAYWEHCGAVVRLAESLGLYMALLPAWGSIVKAGILNEENVEQYAEYLYRRFGSCPNVIWLLGGDIRGDVKPELYRTFGRRLKERMPDKLVGFHPFGRTSSSLWFHGESWLDFNMFQSGHRRYDQAVLKQWDDVAEEFYGEDNWKYVDRDLGRQCHKPTVDGEPSYEWIPQGLHDPSEPFWQAQDVRRYAYWSVFQGAMGHTYGDNSVMQFYSDLSEPGAYGAREVWQDAIHHEGSGHMGHLAALMNSVDFTRGAAAERLLLSGQKEKYGRISVFAGPDFLFCYDYLGEGFTVSLAELQGRKLNAYWYDPVSGAYSFLREVTGLKEFAAAPPKRYAGQNDWVLVIWER